MLRESYYTLFNTHQFTASWKTQINICLNNLLDSRIRGFCSYVGESDFQERNYMLHCQNDRFCYCILQKLLTCVCQKSVVGTSLNISVLPKLCFK